jgi:hypothetical protein
VPIGNTCSAGKVKCVGALFAGLFKCEIKAHKAGVPADPACIAKAVAKYDGGGNPAKGCFAKLEAKQKLGKIKTLCDAIGNAQAAEDKVNLFVALTVAGLERRGLPHKAIELQMLHGMADQLKAAAVDMNLRLREYVPVGEMIPGMAYLVRRRLENTSNESWLKAGYLDNADTAELLARPAPRRGAGGGAGAPSGNGAVGTAGADGGPRDLVEIAPERLQLPAVWPDVGD